MIDSTLKNGKVLIVDDQKANVDVLEVYLEMQGFEDIKTTTDPRQVVPLLTSFNPDLILLDLTMPYLNGFEVMEQVKAVIPENTYLPILVLTADVSTETKQRAIGCGANDFLIKPFDLFEVGIRIRNLLYARYLWQQSQGADQAHEEALKHKIQELEALNNLKDKSFSVIVHDLKNPFSTLISSSNLLLKSLERAPVDTEKLSKIASNLNDASLFGYQLLINLLEWFRLQTGVTPFNPKLEDLKKSVELIMADLEATARKKQIKIINNIPADIMVNMDAEMIQLTIEHLVSNGIKYAFNFGEVTIAAEKNENEVRVLVRDTGIGIEEVMREKLFRMEEKFSCPGTEGEIGTGMGLLLCQEYVRKHKGKIWCESHPGHGSSFYFTINNGSGN